MGGKCMARKFRLPDLGEGIHEAEVLAILVAVGDEVREGDPLMEIETDKAAVEIPSPFTGKVKEILVKPGDVIKVDDVLIVFGNGEAIEEKEPKAKVKESVEEAVSEAEPGPAEGPVPASPATRRLARELGVDLHRVTPGGPEGLVTAEDVRTFAEKGGKAAEGRPSIEEKPLERKTGIATVPPLPDFSKWGPVERVQVRSVRKATVKQMTLAWSQIPHVNSQDAVDITRLEAFRLKHRAAIEARGGKLTLTVFVVKAAATALKTYPKFNSSLDTEAGEIIVKHYFNIGVAVDTEDGLIVPVIRDVDRKSIQEISIELNDLIQKTRARKTTLEELQGGTFTITNVGPMGGGHFSPIINYPEVAILGMGSARLQPVIQKKEKNEHVIVPRLMMPIVLCIDHRVVDGADAIRFMRVIIEALEDPDELLMKMI
jgi:pyruvate dehydrogenase E2 component (dihydrolipoamide acetyltransferase)